MKYRKLGNTNLMVSEVGIGCEGFAEDNGALVHEMIDIAEESGINYIDLYTADPEVRSSLGKALTGRRDKFLIQGHVCSVWKNGQYKRTRNIDEVESGFKDLLKLLNTDYIDMGMIHYVDSIEDWKEIINGPVSQYVRKLKSDGIIHHIGISSHNPIVALEAVKSGLIEVLMFSVNPCYDLQPGNEDLEQLWADENYEKDLVNMDPDRQRLYEECDRLGVGITVMKAFGGGDLLDDELSPAGKALTVYQCMHYALTRPAVTSVLAGSRSIEQLKDCIGYSDASDEEKDFTTFPKISWTGHCMYCNHCLPCPKNIDIATVTKFLNLAKAQGSVPETVREHYEVLEHKAGDCIACGACEPRCPFGVEIINNMKQAKNIFGK